MKINIKDKNRNKKEHKVNADNKAQVRRLIDKHKLVNGINEQDKYMNESYLFKFYSNDVSLVTYFFVLALSFSYFYGDTHLTPSKNILR